ncbi:hypothetical protein [Paenibacillus elgii]|uniref:hypothetical protein n=1 Tax=Paenibacillus elgii TaxID=189691 RepID=UPI00203BC228|nr:hypothetical protein [Paenibacillus elgii]MCM3270654.1 hypothetical protein [Paenibacillus elgii]
MCKTPDWVSIELCLKHSDVQDAFFIEKKFSKNKEPLKWKISIIIDCRGDRSRISNGNSDIAAAVGAKKVSFSDEEVVKRK